MNCTLGGSAPARSAALASTSGGVHCSGLPVPARWRRVSSCHLSSASRVRASPTAGRRIESVACSAAPGDRPQRVWNDSYDGSCPADAGHRGSGRRWDVLGLGQAIVDFNATVSDDFLAAAGVPKGGRKVITVDERGEVISNLDGSAYEVGAGGSLSNSLVALARLGRAEAQLFGSEPLQVALGGSIGADPLGEFYRAQISKAGVEFLSAPQADSATGTVVVLTTADAQRSFMSYPGTTHDLVADPATGTARASRLLVIEGYLWEMPGAAEGIAHAIAVAKAAGTTIAMSAGDVGVVQRHRTEMLAALDAGVDVMFTNAAEASALMGVTPECAEEAAMMLGSHAALAVVTDGAKGAYLACLGRVQHAAPHWADSAPVDTNGAGDAYAAGVLYGLLNGYDIGAMAACGARVASAVISRHGARLKKEDALALVAEMAALDNQGAVLPPPRGEPSVVPMKLPSGATLRTFRPLRIGEEAP